MHFKLHTLLPLLVFISSCFSDEDAPAPLPECPPLPTTLDLSRDLAEVREVFLEPHCLGVVVTYTGGCLQQVVGLSWDGEVQEVEKMPTAYMKVHHRSIADTCDSLFVDTLRYDLGRLQAVGETLRIVVEDPVGGSAEAIFSPR